MLRNSKRAKELYFSNFASHMTMKKNGEFKEYRKFRISQDKEYEWSLEMKEKLMDEIISGFNLLQVVNLSKINLPQSEIITAFQTLSNSSIKDRIFATIQELQSLFEANLYKKILSLFH